MKLLFDASALLNVIREARAQARAVLEGQFILPLTKFEVGNAIWKEACLRGRISVSEAFELIRLMERVFRVLTLVEPSSWSTVLDVACRLGTTVYDSAYVVVSLEWGLLFVTDDERLRRKIAEGSKYLCETYGRKPAIITSAEILQAYNRKDSQGS